METLTAVLKRIEIGLDGAVRAIDAQRGAKGGRAPLRYRPALIKSLLDIWIGFEFAKAGPADFDSFCGSVMETIGWPTGGMDAAIRDGKKEFIDFEVRSRGLTLTPLKKSGG